jgi:hypothetical protein
VAPAEPWVLCQQPGHKGQKERTNGSSSSASGVSGSGSRSAGGGAGSGKPLDETGDEFQIHHRDNRRRVATYGEELLRGVGHAVRGGGDTRLERRRSSGIGHLPGRSYD